MESLWCTACHIPVRNYGRLCRLGTKIAPTTRHAPHVPYITTNVPPRSSRKRQGQISQKTHLHHGDSGIAFTQKVSLNRCTLPTIQFSPMPVRNYGRLGRLGTKIVSFSVTPCATLYMYHRQRPTFLRAHRTTNNQIIRDTAHPHHDDF